MRERGQSYSIAPSGQYGAVTIEYAFCMILAGIMLSGVFSLFSTMSFDILRSFMEWIASPYP